MISVNTTVSGVKLPKVECGFASRELCSLEQDALFPCGPVFLSIRSQQCIPHQVGGKHFLAHSKLPENIIIITFSGWESNKTMNFYSKIIYLSIFVCTIHWV